MCIAILSSAHPEYPFILINNRDEFLDRPTKRASWWDSPQSHVLGGRDLQRPAQGTWLGLTKQGRLALLTNFREEGQLIRADRSRGEMPKAWLTLPEDSGETPEAFARRLVEDVGVDGVGGFSLIFGLLRASRDGEHGTTLGIISNKTPDVQGVIWISRDGEIQGSAGTSPSTIGQTCALSNSHFGDHVWPKVVAGEAALDRAIIANVSQGQSDLSDLQRRCFAVLSMDSLPERKPQDSWDVVTRGMRDSIFIPPIGGGMGEQPADALAAAENSAAVQSSAGKYGTQKQTVIVVDRHGHVTFLEKTLYDDSAHPVPSEQQLSNYEFQIEGWAD